MESFSCRSGETSVYLRTAKAKMKINLINSPKDIANLKNEIEKRQTEGASENSDEVKEGASELPKDEAIAKAPAAVQS